MFQRDKIHLVDFLPFSQDIELLSVAVSFPEYQVLSEKGFTLKEKKNIDLFLEWRQNSCDRFVSLKVY